MPSNSRSDSIPQEEWEKYRADITSLFQNLSYAQIIDHLGTKYNFYPRYVLLRFAISTDMVTEIKPTPVWDSSPKTMEIAEEFQSRTAGGCAYQSPRAARETDRSLDW